MPGSAAVARTARRGSDRATDGRYPLGLTLLLVAPLLALLGAAFVYPVGRMLWGSLAAPDLTFVHYARLLHEPLHLRILWRTIEIGLAVTAAALALGYPVALAMARLQGAWTAIIAACVLVPLWTSVLVRSYAWITLLQRNGVVNTVLVETGIVGAPLRLIYTEGAVIAAMTHVLLPFMILPLYAALRSIPPELERAALNLGAGPLRAFWHVTLPLSRPGIAAGCLMVFILALGFYVTPALLGGPRTLLMATLIGQQTTELLDWPFAGALSAVLLLSTLAVVAAFRRTLQLGREMRS